VGVLARRIFLAVGLDAEDEPTTSQEDEVSDFDRGPATALPLGHLRHQMPSTLTRAVTPGHRDHSIETGNRVCPR
jgi:hypothetical protein